MMTTSSHRPVIVWLRRDLRLNDHAALSAAVKLGRPVIPVFIFDEVVSTLGAAPSWRLGLGLRVFKDKLLSIGSNLILRKGNAREVLEHLVQQTGAEHVFWSRGYDPAAISRDTQVKETLKKAGIKAKSFQGHLLYEPWEPKTKAGGQFKVYTPFWRAVSSGFHVDAPLPVISSLPAPDNWPSSDDLEDWEMESRMERGAAIVLPHTVVGEDKALARLDNFIEDHIDGYKEDRDFPMLDASSGLSENLTYGEISPRQIYAAGYRQLQEGKRGAEHFLKELCWREFAYHLLWHAPDLDQNCWKPEWETFPWQGESEKSDAWKQARTGEPFVDAGMRELYVTGIIHNRLRMIVGSYLTKHLQTDWRVGRKWFEECLIDWDPASNAMGWQWIAGCGPDAALYFRVFNPALQSERFDKDEGYRTKWLNPAVSAEAKGFFEAVPKSWGLSAENAYPARIIALSQGRDDALTAYKSFKT